MTRYSSLFIILLLLITACSNPDTQPEAQAQAQTNNTEATQPPAEDPTIWEDDIAAFEAEDEAQTPPEDALLFVGSSSIRLWDSLKEDMAPMPVIQRGFGGSKLGDCIHYADRIVTPYAPKALVVFCGSNDIAGDNPKSAETVFGLYKDFVATVHADLPGLPIYFIAISPTSSRWEHRDIVAEANRLVEAYSAQHEELYFINTAVALLDENGASKEELFREDKLHLNADGYAVWTSIIRPEMEKMF